MKTAVDSSVLLDVLMADPHFGTASREALRSAYDSGALVACSVVWAEVRAYFPSAESFAAAMETLGIRFEALTSDAATLAGELWRASRKAAGSSAGKATRERVVADFLVGAHAWIQAECLLTRDQRFYRTRFAGLTVIGPRHP